MIIDTIINLIPSRCAMIINPGVDNQLDHSSVGVDGKEPEAAAHRSGRRGIRGFGNAGCEQAPCGHQGIVSRFTAAS